MLLAEGLVLAPLVVVMGLSFLPSIKAPVYPLMLALLPLFGLAYKFGWRQGAIALGLLAVGIYFVTGPLIALWGPGQLQVLIALTSCAALLLGISSETQQVQQKVLSQAVETLTLRRSQLAVAANRMAALQEEERRRIGAELHDQIGQDMTAIATRLRVIERKAIDPSVRDGLASIGLLVSDAHVHLREVINHLHPAVLDRFGLARALADGPFAEMLRDKNDRLHLHDRGRRRRTARQRGQRHLPHLPGSRDQLRAPQLRRRTHPAVAGAGGGRVRTDAWKSVTAPDACNSTNNGWAMACSTSATAPRRSAPTTASIPTPASRGTR